MGPVLRWCLKWAVIAAIWMLVVGLGAVAWFAYDLPDIRGLHVFNRRPSLTLVSADGQIAATYGDLYGGPVELKDLPAYLPRAVLATEDRRFYDHFGIDPFGLVRAVFVNLRERRISQGGSTITQQLAKNVFLTNERSLRRKVQETLLALWLERRLTKDQILTIYLNRMYLGAGTYGVEAAAKRYFGRSARALNAHEAAVIAGLLKAPSRYAPTNNLALAKTRASEVLDNLVEAGFFTPAQAKAAEAEPLRLAPIVGGAQSARYFGDWLADQVPGFIGFVDRDLTVMTTLDLRLQRVAETALTALLDRDGAKAGVDQGALVALTPDGAVRALVGGRRYADSQFNRATTAQRQPGSAFKPFVYLAAVEAGFSADDRVSDAPIAIGGWRPRNFDDKTRGEITLREALARSVNTATVRLAQRLGVDRVIGVAKRLGLQPDFHRELSVALGTNEVSLLELTGAYAPFANGGMSVIPYAVTEIRDTAGHIVYRRSGSGGARVIGRNALAEIDDMLAAVIKSGTGRAAALDRPAGGKTGTSQEFRDAWFVGFTADFVTGVWLGNDDGTPMEAVTGGSLPAKLWRTFMVEANQGLPIRPIPGGAGDGDGPRLAGDPPARRVGAPGADFTGGNPRHSTGDLDPTAGRMLQ